MSKRYVHGRGLSVLALVLFATGAVTQIPEAPSTKSGTTEQGSLNKRTKGPHLRVIRMTLGESRGLRGKQTVATAVLFDHKAGKARRVSMDVDLTGGTLVTEPKEGDPKDPDPKEPVGRGGR